MSKIGPPSDRVTVRRSRRRGRYDRRTIYEILDCGLVCHVGFLFEGRPVVIPTFYWREGDRLYWHGSVQSRMLRAVEGAAVCITVTHLDGLVAARSAFHHSANYRSVVLFGTAQAVLGADEKQQRMEAMMESILPNRWPLLRPLTEKELAATQILWLPINEASAKVRSGPPADLEDLDWQVWAGVIPLSTVAGEPEEDGALPQCPLAAPNLLRPKRG